MNKVFSMIGLATRAGKTVAGEFSVEKAVKDNKAKVVIVSTESSDNTKKLFENKCKFYKIPVFIYGTKAELGMATGNKAVSYTHLKSVPYKRKNSHMVQMRACSSSGKNKSVPYKRKNSYMVHMKACFSSE